MAENYMNVVEYLSFDEAFEAATETKKSFAAFQMGSKKAMMKEYGQRFFVDENMELWYTVMVDCRLLHKAEVYSMLSNGGFEHVQIMVSLATRAGQLRFSGVSVNCRGAVMYSQGEGMDCNCFYKS